MTGEASFSSVESSVSLFPNQLKARWKQGFLCLQRRVQCYYFLLVSLIEECAPFRFRPMICKMISLLGYSRSTSGDYAIRVKTQEESCAGFFFLFFFFFLFSFLVLSTLNKKRQRIHYVCKHAVDSNHLAFPNLNLVCKAILTYIPHASHTTCNTSERRDSSLFHVGVGMGWAPFFFCMCSDHMSLRCY